MEVAYFVGEQVEYRAKISIAAVIVLWMSVPVFLAIGFCSSFLPKMIGNFVGETLTDSLMEGLELETASFGDILSAIGKDILEAIPSPVLGVLIVLFVLLILCWLGWAIVCTKLHFCYSLELTNFRVIAGARKQSFEVKTEELKNVFVAQSLLGKICRYGSVTVAAEHGCITVHNVSDPYIIKTLLMQKMTDENTRTLR